MQIGDHEQALIFPEQRTAEIGDEGNAGDVQNAVSDNRKNYVFRHGRVKPGHDDIDVSGSNKPTPPKTSPPSRARRRLPPAARPMLRHKLTRDRFPASPAPPMGKHARVPGARSGP